MTADAQSGLQVGRECFLRVMDQRFYVEILGVAKDTIWVSFSASDYPLEGMGAELEFYDHGGFLCYHTRVAQGPKKKGDGVLLQRAEAASYLKHRRTWRVTCDLAVWIWTQTGGSPESARLVDLSAEGASIETATEYPVGTPLDMSFTLPGKTTEMLGARVIHIEPPGILREAKLGIKFIEVKKEAREALTYYLWAKIREKYPRELQSMYPRRSSRP